MRAGGGRAEGSPERDTGRQLLASFGPVALEVPRARMAAADSGTQEWRSTALPRYARMTRQVEALIAGAYLAGTNTHRVKRALAALFGRAVGKDVVGGTWRKVRTDWGGRNKRDMADEDVIRLILDGTVVRVRLDRKATNISLLVVLGVRRDGQKVTAWVPAACARRSSSSLIPRPEWSGHWRHCGPKCPPGAVPFTSTEICWATRRMRCTRKSRPTTRT